MARAKLTLKKAAPKKAAKKAAPKKTAKKKGMTPAKKTAAANKKRLAKFGAGGSTVVGNVMGQKTGVPNQRTKGQNIGPRGGTKGRRDAVSGRLTRTSKG
jgi:hypothetical protein